LTGIGVLYGKGEHLKTLLPSISGGGAVQEVTLVDHTYQPIPDKFEPGTPNVVAAVSLDAALRRIASLDGSSNETFRDQLAVGFDWLATREKELIDFFSRRMHDISTKREIQLIGSLEESSRIGLFSFTLPSTTQGEQALGRYLAQKNICIRVGAHCTHPLHTQLLADQSARVSLWVYNDVEDVHLFFSVLEQFLCG